MPLRIAILVTVFLAAATPCPAAGKVTRVWLSHRTPDPTRLVVSYTTPAPEESVVRYGPTAAYGGEARVAGRRTLHHVEIPLPAGPGGAVHYSAGDGPSASADAAVRIPGDELRVAVVADRHTRPDLSALLRDEPHLLLTAGDNVPSLHGRCGAGVEDCVTPYAELIDAYPELFRSVPSLPALGNHDKEVRPRGSEPPAEPAYDVGAAAFREFFELPGDEWKWRFDVPAFGVRFVAVDLHHVSDFGTTWQSCHAFDADSEQFRWYRDRMDDPGRPPLAVTLYNEKHSTVRGLAGGAWGREVGKGTLAVSGFGHFAERAEADGLPCLNTSLRGRGDRYPDPHSRFLAGVDNYLLLTVGRETGTLTAELKGLDGAVLDRTECHARGPR